MLKFVWDTRKAEGNLRKHAVTFDEAKSVFSDPHAETHSDPIHSADEDRFITIGTTARGRLVVVVHVDVDATTIRIISARPATVRERQDHEEA